PLSCAISYMDVLNLATQIAFHPWLAEHGTEFCEELARAFREGPPPFSVGVSRAPFGAGELALLLGAPALPICLDETEALFGPLWISGRTVCPDCLEHWLDNNLFDRKAPTRAPGAIEARAVS